MSLFASPSAPGFDAPASSGGNAVPAAGAYNAWEPFGRVESTKQCFARIGEAAAASKWTPPKPPSRPLFQASSGPHSSARDTVPLFGPSTQQRQWQSKPLFASGNQAAVSGGGFTSGHVAPGTSLFYNHTSAGSSSVDPGFGGPRTVFGHAGNASRCDKVDPGFGEKLVAFGSASSTVKPPLAPTSNSFASSTKQVGGVLSNNPFASKGASTSNPFTLATASLNASPFKFPSLAANPFAARVSANASVNPFAAKVASNASVNPFAVKESSNAPVESFDVSKFNLFAVTASAWLVGSESARGAASASTKFKRGLRPAFNLDASPWRTGSQQQPLATILPASPASFDWAGWGEKNASTRPSAEISFKMPNFSSSETESSSSDPPSSPPAMSSPPDILVASPDTDPYGSGSFGAGLVEQKIKTAIANPSLSVELKVLDDRSSAALSSSIPRQQRSARFAARLGLARQPLQAVPMRPMQIRFPGRRQHTAPSSARAKLPQADPFSRLTISKKALRIRVEPSPMPVTATDSPKPVEEGAGVLAAAAEPDDASKSAEESEQDNSDSPSPACPVLLNKEYFTEPSLSELQQLTDDELRNMENFVIGRRGCGKIAFIGATDVRGLQLDQLVTFSEGEVVVYPDDSAKPAIGSRLNKPAIVDLHGISAKENEAHEDFLKRLEGHTQALGAVFLKYEGSEKGASGVWSFRVEHF
ncbi:hypothetical protein PHYPSEUDO_004151 [Phytophthora pseudosyringae]|uniref:Peptidase S59 domain-containing protein n=1 Tax=Phytophthora pseudosyringae TaxID=221518 RepID=A0A8T1WIW8_9STRA|nr:hypothetical protein PHYPSEUDO_004151 [Phytophthora pseudosyringae]